jgi:sugar phosphate isomerase/epimerase
MRTAVVAVLAAVLSLGVLAAPGAAQGPGKGHGQANGKANGHAQAKGKSKAGMRDNAGCAGRGVPVSKISVQQWTFAEYIGFGTDAATQQRLENVLAFLSETGYRNIELFTLSGLTAEQMRDLLDEYGLKAVSRHVNVGTPASPVNFEQILEENRTLGIKFFGSGGTPNFATEAEWVAYAEYLNELGEQARKAGQTLMVHNHNWEFERVFGDRTAFDILVEHTDPRNVVFQLDLYWAVRGIGTQAGVTTEAAEAMTADLIERLGNRVQLAHVKDMGAGAFPGRIEIVGEGVIDFPELFEATKGPLRYYVVEHDPRFGDPTFDPFEAAEAGFEYLTCVRY